MYAADAAINEERRKLGLPPLGGGTGTAPGIQEPPQAVGGQSGRPPAYPPMGGSNSGQGPGWQPRPVQPAGPGNPWTPPQAVQGSSSMPPAAPGNNAANAQRDKYLGFGLQTGIAPGFNNAADNSLAQGVAAIGKERLGDGAPPPNNPPMSAPPPAYIGGPAETIGYNPNVPHPGGSWPTAQPFPGAPPMRQVPPAAPPVGGTGVSPPIQSITRPAYVGYANTGLGGGPPPQAVGGQSAQAPTGQPIDTAGIIRRIMMALTPRNYYGMNDSTGFNGMLGSLISGMGLPPGDVQQALLRSYPGGVNPGAITSGSY